MVSCDRLVAHSECVLSSHSLFSGSGSTTILTRINCLLQIKSACHFHLQVQNTDPSKQKNQGLPCDLQHLDITSAIAIVYTNMKEVLDLCKANFAICFTLIYTRLLYLYHILCLMVLTVHIHMTNDSILPGNLNPPYQSRTI